MDQPRITIGELVDQLRHYPRDAELDFGATLAGVPLVFYRVKSRSQDNRHIQIELNEFDGKYRKVWQAEQTERSKAGRQ